MEGTRLCLSVPAAEQCLVKKVENYPEGFMGKEKIEYERTCTVECMDCGKVLTGQKYD